MKQRIVLASGNQGKVTEFQFRLGDYFELVAQTDLGVFSPPETGLTFVENALIKARAACKETQLPAIADDSGLCVDTLNGAPGIYSARFAGENAIDSSNNQLLLKQLKGVEVTHRQAFFHCTLVYMKHADDPAPIICSANWHGHICIEPSGEGGFGYDPIFFSTEQQCVSACLPSSTKNKVSHRGQAINQLLAKLTSI